MKKILINIVVLLMFSTSAFSKDVTEIIGFQLEFNQLNFVENLENFKILKIRDKEIENRKWWEYKTLPKSIKLESEIEKILRSDILPDGTSVWDMMPISADKFAYDLEYKDLSKAPPYEDIRVELMCYDGFLSSNQLDLDNPKHLKNIKNNKGCEFPFIHEIVINVEPGRGSNEPNCRNDLNFYKDYFLNTYDLKSYIDSIGSDIYSSLIGGYFDDLYPSDYFPKKYIKKGLHEIRLYCDNSGVSIAVQVVQSFEELNTVIKTVHKELIEAANNKVKNSKENETGGL